MDNNEKPFIEESLKKLKFCVTEIDKLFRVAIREAYGHQILEYISDEDAHDLHEVYMPLMSYDEMNEMDDGELAEEDYEETYKEYWGVVRRLRPILVRLASGNKSKQAMSSMTNFTALIAAKEGRFSIPENTSDHEIVIRHLVSDFDEDHLLDEEDVLDRCLITAFRFRVEC